MLGNFSTSSSFLLPFEAAGEGVLTEAEDVFAVEDTGVFFSVAFSPALSASSLGPPSSAVLALATLSADGRRAAGVPRPRPRPLAVATAAAAGCIPLPLRLPGPAPRPGTASLPGAPAWGLEGRGLWPPPLGAPLGPPLGAPAGRPPARGTVGKGLFVTIAGTSVGCCCCWRPGGLGSGLVGLVKPGPARLGLAGTAGRGFVAGGQRMLAGLWLAGDLASFFDGRLRRVAAFLWPLLSCSLMKGPGLVSSGLDSFFMNLPFPPPPPPPAPLSRPVATASPSSS
mmetsp:Transcript_5437/g.20786  ORF Transcript_5437/g.20786 Transcript_5437/m.20786 type:complete len:283 (+) Transcript_5437:489-1337(+)